MGGGEGFTGTGANVRQVPPVEPKQGANEGGQGCVLYPRGQTGQINSGAEKIGGGNWWV